MKAETRRKVPGWPRWAVYATFGQGYRVGQTWQLPVRVVVNRRRAMLWAVLSGRVRVRRG